MNHTLRRAVGVAACTLALAATTAGTAHAETQTHKDPRGDVTTIQLTAKAAAPAIDITSSTNTFEGRTLTMSVKAVKLAKQGYAAQWFVKTPATNYVLIYDRTGPEPSTQFFDIGPDPFRVSPSTAGIPPVCDGVTVKARVNKSRVTAVVPRSCFSADTVRVAAALVKPTEGGVKVDDARRTGFPNPNAAPKFGPSLDRD